MNSLETLTAQVQRYAALTERPEADFSSISRALAELNAPAAGYAAASLAPETQSALEQLIVLVKKSDRLLFASFGRAVQSVSGLYLFPASTVRPSLRVKVCSGLVDVGISGVTGPRLPAPMTVTRQLVS